MTTKETRCVACGEVIVPGKVMCDEHWALLPFRAQQDVCDVMARAPNDPRRREMLVRAGAFVRKKLAVGTAVQR